MNQEKKSKWTRCITINTDASFHPTQKVGGYAFHIVCDHFRIKKGGKFKANPENPEEAELMCMANALYTLLMREDLPATGGEANVLMHHNVLQLTEVGDYEAQIFKLK